MIYSIKQVPPDPGTNSLRPLIHDRCDSQMGWRAHLPLPHRGEDTIVGNVAANEISSEPGNDTISAAAGDDRIDVKDGVGDDEVDCGEDGAGVTDNDTVSFDDGDTVTDCETLKP
jgi:RTX calcium-binding nonapeptide repeat (4 copies)